MDTHLAFQARINDYTTPTTHEKKEEAKEEETQKPSDANEEKRDLDTYESSAEAEVEVDEQGEEGIVKEQGERDTNTNTNNMGKAVKPSANVSQVRESGGHTPGEVWTESPHFLWGP
jgi:cell division septation protein DedD